MELSGDVATLRAGDSMPIFLFLFFCISLCLCPLLLLSICLLSVYPSLSIYRFLLLMYLLYLLDLLAGLTRYK